MSMMLPPPRGEVANYLYEKGFESAFESYNRDHCPTKVDKWISHRSHRNELVGVDYIWHLQPHKQDGSMAADWRKLVFQEIRKELPDAVHEAFRVFDKDHNMVSA